MTLKLKHVVTVEKKFERRSAPEKIKEQVIKLRDRALGGNRAERGWDCKLRVCDPKYLNKGVIYSYDLELNYAPRGDRTQEQVNKEVDNIAQIIQSAGGTGPKGDKIGWRVVAVNDKPYSAKKTVTEEGQELIPYAPCEIRQDWQKFFSHIYDREYQINIVMSRIQAAIDSDWTNRFHNALVGEPAGGKTEVCRALKAMLGDSAVLELDATSTTQAGVIKELRDRTELPRVVLVEEIEKANFKELPWLLSMLDPRGEIRKLNFRSKILFQMRGLCIATINNWKLFKNVLEGALASRFGDPIFFPRPSEAILRKILTREVHRIRGNMAWIDPTIEFCKESKITDPRSALSICLSGKDMLLGAGDYQKMLRATRMPENYND